MSDSNTKFTKGVTIKEAGSLTPKEIEILPGGTAETKTTLRGSQTVDVVIDLPDATTVLVGTDVTQTLTNKTIDADNNTLSNIENDNIKASAGIDASKIADGSVSNTEFQYLGGVTSDVQTQLNDNNTLIVDHIADTVDAHDASAISSTPAGNLVATDVQGALNELQSDVDLRALDSDLTDHINASVAHTAISIENTPSGNLTATTVQEALDELQSELDGKLSGSELTDHINDTTTHGTTGNIVGTSDVQVLTNKDIDGGTASNTSRITLPKAAKTTLDGLTRKAGTLVFDTTSSKPYYDDGTTLKLVGSESSGVKNFITNGNAESGSITGWTSYDDGGTSRPVNGTGGSASGIFDLTVSSTNPLSDVNSFLMTKTASAVPGYGLAYDFSIDNANKSKMLNISFDYMVDSGTFVAGSSTTDSDVIVYLYDVTNSRLIEPSTFKLYTSSTTLPERFNAYFQASPDSTSYRLIFHIATTNSDAFALKVDNIAVSPTALVQGTVITDWQSYTPTGSWTAATTYTGWWRRVGGSLEARVNLAITGTPTNAELTINLPSGLNIDTGIINTSDNVAHLGAGKLFETGVGSWDATVFYNLPGSVKVRALSASGSYTSTANLSNTVPFTWGSGDNVDVEFSAPIVGWSAGAQVADGYDGRVVSGKFTKNVSQSIATGGSATTVTFATSSIDTVAGWNGTDTYTVRTAGEYVIEGQITYFGTAASGEARVQLLIDGSTVEYAYASKSGTVSVTHAIPFKFKRSLTAGQTIKIGAWHVFGSTIDLAGDNTLAGLTQLSIEKLSGAAFMSPSDVVAAVYKTSAGQSISNITGTIINFGTSEIDTHSSVTTGASWKFTAQAAGLYEVSALVTYNSGGGWSAGEEASVTLNKNGTQRAILGEVFQQATHTALVTIPCPARLIELNAGDYIDLRTYQSSGASLTLYNQDIFNWVSIKKVK